MSTEKEKDFNKIIAFYLPQYHCIPENDKWWGKGFTEWTNTRKAKPLFKGHYQPKTPLNENYYNLLDEDVMLWQSELAKKYGVYGFCYYHYWFKNGKKLLEKPIEQMLDNKRIEMPFCLSWANENWTRNWDGGKNEVILEQNYGDKDDWNKHFNYLNLFFKDKRYIKIDNKPLFIIYKPQLISNLSKMMKFFEKRAIESGYDGIVFMCQHPSWIVDKRFNSNLFDYIIKFEPFFTMYTKNKNIDINKMSLENHLWHTIDGTPLKYLLAFAKKIRSVISTKAIKEKKLITNNYNEYWEFILNDSMQDKKLIPGAFTDWDNTARKKNGMMFIGANPDKFGEYLKKLINLKSNKKTGFIFINAWNEWAEGAYLEPDERYGYAYLEGVKKAIEHNL